LSVKAGINVFRIFDALNDVRNMEWAIKCVKKYGGEVQGAFSYTISPVHSIDTFVAIAKELKELGADTICIKDMAALCLPYEAYELTRRLKQEVGLPVQFHTHETGGFGMASLLKAAEAGVDIVDTAISSIGGGTAQPPTETFVAMMQGTERDTGLDLSLLAEISQHFAKVRKEHLARFETGITSADIRVLLYQIPGGMLSNLVNQLRDQGALNRYEDVLKELPNVRRDLGYPPLVTPTSQMVGTQAVLNVLTGERYKVIPQEIRDYCLGMYGRPPGEINPEVRKMAIGHQEPLSGRPADYIEPGWEKAKSEIGDLAECDEDIMSYACFPREAREFFELRRAGKVPPIEEPRVFPAVAQSTAKSDARAAMGPTLPAQPCAESSLWKLASRVQGR
ncbi:MAG: pyruvate carboxylase subunit B, partial [Chloroflexi bacterium]|nr:pyruvate carboxylase subunit B [Chloroflexota bacterium]